MTPRKPPSDDQLREAFVGVGDALQRAVLLSSDRVQSVFEDAVLRGRMTRRDAEELASSLVALGRDQAQELRSEVDTLARSIPSRVAASVDPRTKRRKKKARESADEATQAEADTLVASAKTVPAGKPKPKAAAKPTPKAVAKPKAAAKPKVAAKPTASVPAVTARALIASVPSLAAGDLAALRKAEVTGKNRATVLAAIDKALAKPAGA